MSDPVIQGVSSAPGSTLADTAATPPVNHGVMITSLTRVGTTATAKSYGHGLVTGTYTLQGFDTAGYNGAKAITVDDADTFHFTVAGTEPTPAKGSLPTVLDPNSSRVAQRVSGIQVETPPVGTTLKIEKRLHALGSWVQEGTDITSATATVIVLYDPPMAYVRVRRSAGTGDYKAYTQG